MGKFISNLRTATEVGMRAQRILGVRAYARVCVCVCVHENDNKIEQMIDASVYMCVWRSSKLTFLTNFISISCIILVQFVLSLLLSHTLSFHPITR